MHLTGFVLNSSATKKCRENIEYCVTEVVISGVQSHWWGNMIPFHIIHVNSFDVLPLMLTVLYCFMVNMKIKMFQ